MIPYVTFREPLEGQLQYFILQKAFPHFVGVLTYLPVDNRIIPSIPISGYNLWVTFNGTLRGNMIPTYNNIDKEAMEALNAMAIWFYQNRILPDEKRYKKFKIQPNVSSPAQ